MRVSVFMFARINQISIVRWSKQQTRYELFRHISVFNNFKIECLSVKTVKVYIYIYMYNVH